MNLYRKLKNYIFNFFVKIGVIKNPTNFYFWMKNKDITLFFDGIFKDNFAFIIKNCKYNGYNYVKVIWKAYTNIKYNQLILWLDYKSIDIVDRYYTSSKVILENLETSIPYQIVSISDNIRNSKLKHFIKNYTKDLYFPYQWLPETFFYKHWINHIINIKEYTKNKDVIDCWAYVWDSALMFAKELSVRKIVCLEPDSHNFEILKDIIEKNNYKNFIEPIQIWVWKEIKQEKFSVNMNSCSCLSVDWNEIIQISTIDNIVKEKKLNPWLIKMDIEWAEYDSILWAENTIKKFKPDLLISIYHTAKDFFEIKPLLESWNIWYKFKIVHCTEWINFCEIMLLAYIE